MRRLAPALVVALVLALLFVGLINGDAIAQSARQRFEWVIAKRLTVDTTADVTGAATFGNAVTMAGDARVGGNVLATGLVNAGTWLASGQQSTAVLTMNGTLTPTGSYQPISATATSALSQVVVPAAGIMLRIVNVGATTITLTDTGVLKLAGNAALSGTDSLTVLSDGTNLIELGRSDN